jgi:hypothetical protein
MGSSNRSLPTHRSGLPSFEGERLVALGENTMKDLASVLETWWS